MSLLARHRSLFLPVLLLAAVAMPMAHAQAADKEPRDRGSQDRGQQRRDEQRALSDAVRRVGRASGGEVLSAERVQSDGRDISRVKVVDSSGRVRVYMDDPQRGRQNEHQGERTRRDDNDND